MPREWAFRRGRPSDVPYIMDGWLKTLSSTLRASEKSPEYRSAQKLVIASLLEDSYVYVATGVEDDNLLLGFICAEAHERRVRALLHYIYVTRTWRQMGVARSLLRHFMQREMPRAAWRAQNIVITDCPMPWQYHYAKGKGWSLGLRRTYYHALAKEMRAGQGAKAG